MIRDVVKRSVETQAQAIEPGRYWVVGGRCVDDGRCISWPRVFGPYDSQATAEFWRAELIAGAEALVRYDVVKALDTTE